MRVPRSQRGGDVVEPLVRDQWFVRAKPLADPALQASGPRLLWALLLGLDGCAGQAACAQLPLERDSVQYVRQTAAQQVCWRLI